MATFYTFKDKKNLMEPLVKNPGDIDGQMFDIGDCENSTLVIMDTCEQVQIDQVKNCRIFIGACASSIFIRNCENCVFYTSCRQLRLREVVNSTFYIYSMSEVHIEYSNALKFAPFNGGYPDHAKHLRSANLDPKLNLWYDIFDHNDPAKDKGNWSLLPVSEYEEPWFPGGVPCELAVPITAAGSVVRTDLAANGGGSGETVGGEQAFSIQHMIADAEKMKAAMAAPALPSAPIALPTTSLPPAVPVPTVKATMVVVTPPAVSDAAAAASSLLSGSNLEVVAAISAYANFKSAEDLLKVRNVSFSPCNLFMFLHLQLIEMQTFNLVNTEMVKMTFFLSQFIQITSEGFTSIQPNGSTLSLTEITAVCQPTLLWEVERISMSSHGDSAWCIFWVSQDSNLSALTKTTAVLEKHGNDWKIVHSHSSQPTSLDEAKSSLATSRL